MDLDPDYVWIVRDVTWFFAGPSAEASFQLFAALTSVTFVSDAQVAVDNPGYSSHWSGRQVFVPVPGDHTLGVNIESELGAGGDVRISGYMLSP